MLQFLPSYRLYQSGGINSKRVSKVCRGKIKENRKEFLEKVLDGFEVLYKNRTDVVHIDGTQSSEIVTQHTYTAIETWLQDKIF